MLGVLYLCTVLVHCVHCGAVDCSAVHSGHGTGLLSPKQSGMDRPSASECLKGEAAQDKQKQKTRGGYETVGALDLELRIYRTFCHSMH